MYELVYIKPIGGGIKDGVRNVIGAIMSHKKKQVRNALVDCSKQIGIPKEIALKAADSFGNPELRPFQMQPAMILDLAESLYLSQKP